MAAGVHSFPRKEGGIQVLAGFVAPFGQSVGTLLKNPCPGSQPEKYMTLFIYHNIINNI